VKVALVQLDCDPDREPHASREAAAVRVGEAAADGARLVVLPELWLHGGFDAEPWPKTAEPRGGETAAAMRQAAEAHGILLHAGSIVERASDGEFYNTSLVFGPEGQDLAVYRKIHRFGFDEGEAAFMSAGRDLVTFDVLDDAARDRLVHNIVGHLLNGVSEPVLLRAFEYWHNVDKDLGDRIETDVRAERSRSLPEARKR